MIENQKYWDNFYQNPPVTLAPPSQFSAFILSLHDRFDRIIELGCGSGRDATLLAKYTDSYIGIDLSEEAIQRCNELNLKASFINGDITNFNQLVSNATNESLLIYSRFVMHSLSQDEENSLLSNFLNFSNNATLFALEYRVQGDELITKIFSDHKRRFINHNNFIKKIEALGFKVIYEIKSQGLACYKSEDALVGRVIFCKSKP